MIRLFRQILGRILSRPSPRVIPAVDMPVVRWSEVDQEAQNELYWDNPTAFWLNPNGPLADPVPRPPKRESISLPVVSVSPEKSPVVENKTITPLDSDPLGIRREIEQRGGFLRQCFYDAMTDGYRLRIGGNFKEFSVIIDASCDGRKRDAVTKDILEEIADRIFFSTISDELDDIMDADCDDDDLFLTL